MTVKDIIHRELPNSPGRRRPAGRPLRRPAGRGIFGRWAGSVDRRVCAVMAALGCVVALFVPWLTLDAHAGSLSGVGLMCYALQGSDRVVMWQISPLATALLLSLPFAVAAGALGTAWNALRGTYRAEAPLVTFAAVLVLLRFTPPVLDGRMHILFNFAVPDPGLGVLLAATLAVIVIGSGAAVRERGLAVQP